MRKQAVNVIATDDSCSFRSIEWGRDANADQAVLVAVVNLLNRCSPANIVLVEGILRCVLAKQSLA